MLYLFFILVIMWFIWLLGYPIYRKVKEEEEIVNFIYVIILDILGLLLAVCGLIFCIKNI